MMQFTRLGGTTLGAAILMMVVSCNKTPDKLSPVKQLGFYDDSCTSGYNQARAQKIAKSIRSFVRTSGKVTADDLALVLSTVPDEYITYLVERGRSEKFYIEVVPSESIIGENPNTAGLTMNYGFPGYMEPLWIQVKENMLEQALVHEVGHAVQTFVMNDPRRRGNVASVDATFQQALFGGDGGNMGSYPRTSSTEYFAELVSHYYCSPQTTASMQQQFPVSYNFAQQVLLPPAWVNGAGGENGSFSPMRPNNFGSANANPTVTQIGSGTSGGSLPPTGFSPNGIGSSAISGLPGNGVGGAFAGLCSNAVQSLGLPAGICQIVATGGGGFMLSGGQGFALADDQGKGFLLAPFYEQEYVWNSVANLVVFAPGVTDPKSIKIKMSDKFLDARFAHDTTSPDCKSYCFTAAVALSSPQSTNASQLKDGVYELSVVIDEARSSYPTKIKMISFNKDDNLGIPAKSFQRNTKSNNLSH